MSRSRGCVCAWCGEACDATTAAPHETRISHGVCTICRERLVTSLRRSSGTSTERPGADLRQEPSEGLRAVRGLHSRTTDP